MSKSNESLYQYLLLLGDNAMILGHRLSELCGHGPNLETDIALTNISLDLFGEVRNLFQYAAKVKGDDMTEDKIAFLRIEKQYRNTILVEQGNVDLFSQAFGELFSSQWMKRLGGGTEESHRRLQDAVDHLYPYTKELFVPTDIETEMAQSGIGVDLPEIEKSFHETVNQVISEAKISTENLQQRYAQGKNGRHTEQMGYILSELQFMQRTYPNMQW
jgi:ring-1,2-phenylacetyl-CoA epoxidase subunit PaaC